MQGYLHSLPLSYQLARRFLEGGLCLTRVRLRLGLARVVGERFVYYTTTILCLVERPLCLLHRAQCGLACVVGGSKRNIRGRGGWKGGKRGRGSPMAEPRLRLWEGHS